MMKSWSAAVAVALCLAAAALPLRAQQSAPSPADAERVQKEVKAAIDRYYQLFTERNFKALPEESYFVPWILLSGSGPEADLSKEAAQARFEASGQQLVASGWGKSVFTTENVCVLNANAAIASGYNTRYKTDGSVMSVGGVTYVLGRAKDGWKIVSYSGHPKGKIVRCDD